jgi:hypothetical protein
LHRLFFLLLLATSVVAQPTATPLQLAWTPTGAELSGLAAGGRAALLAVLRDEEPYQGRTASFSAELTDSDGDGRLRWDLGRPIPAKALVLAVDLSTGRWAWAQGEGLGLAGPRDLSEVELLPGAGAGLSGWKLPATFVQTLIVRPGVGAWLAAVDEGRPGSSDTVADGAAEQLFAASPALGEEAVFPGVETAPSDLVLGVSPPTFRFWVWPAAVAGGEAP